MRNLGPDLNDNKPWTEPDIADLKNHIAHGASLSETASFLCRAGTEFDVAAKAEELGLKWQMGGRRRKPAVNPAPAPRSKRQAVGVVSDHGGPSENFRRGRQCPLLGEDRKTYARSEVYRF